MIFLRTIQIMQIIGAMLVGAIISSQAQAIHDLKVKAAVQEAQGRILMAMPIEALRKVSVDDL